MTTEHWPNTARVLVLGRLYLKEKPCKEASLPYC